MTDKSTTVVERLRDIGEQPSAYALCGDRLNDVFDQGLRHKRGQKPTDYLRVWLSMLRPFAYATRDDSWGELEKLICIVMSNYVRAQRIAPVAATLIASQEALREALEAADKRLCELTPNFPPDIGPDMRDAEEIEQTGAVVMQIRTALQTDGGPE